MLANSKILPVVLALWTGIITACSLLFFSSLSQIQVLGISLTAFIITYVVYYLVFEHIIFTEIHKLYTLLTKVKKKDYQLTKGELVKVEDPLSRLHKEIVDFASRKEQEITELKKLETFRREFLADVSHELKTPIFAAQGFLHTLLDGAMEDEGVRHKFLMKAANNLDSLNVLVEDLLTISQLEIGEIKMHYQNFDVHRLAEEIFEQLEETAQRRGVKLMFHKHTPKSCYIYADKYRIGQVLTNLIVNGIKYGKEKGNIILSFNYQNDYVFISVQDNGPGIESMHLNRIFERFYRVEKSRSKDKGGTGLGLAIVKHILEAHDSKIYVSSKMGEGTIFSFKLRKGKVINEKG
jgi:two-component system phosphate regulon sensor histidine kinase PhoR